MIDFRSYILFLLLRHFSLLLYALSPKGTEHKIRNFFNIQVCMSIAKSQEK